MRPIYVRLRDPEHTLPMPGQPGRFFSADGETVDGDDPFWINLLADGSIEEASASVTSNAGA